MAGDVHGQGKPLGAAVDDAAVQILLGRKRDRMQQEVATAPSAAIRSKARFQLAWNANVAGEEDLAADCLAHRADMRLRLVVEIGDGERGTGSGEGARTACGNARLVGDADHEAALALEAIV